ncbi:GGDEF domain-containing protein [Fundicoccus sp. Sow4_D5]|uniref:GGDEF domain-containing protein n=1 Tax=Fundicoccus sp. Sow4_D5 TaxID=3438782 RepID=UPI003F8E6E2F
MSRIPFSVRRESEASEDYWVKQLVAVSYWIVAINFMAHIALWFYASSVSESVHFDVSFVERILLTFWMLTANFSVNWLVNSWRLPLLVKEYLAIILLIFFCACLCLQYRQASVLLASFIAPVLISTLFSNFRLTRQIFLIAQVLMLVSAYMMYGTSRSTFDSWTQVLTASGMLVGACLLARVQILHSRSTYTNYQHIIQNNEQLELELKLDPLTRLYNRKAYQDMLPKIMEDCRASYQLLSLAVLDIDEFKQVNDTYGHAVGDRVLLMISYIIRQAAMDEFYAFRIGGEEFVFVFPEKSVDAASVLCEEILLNIERLSFSEMNNNGVTGSCGIAGMSRHSSSPIELFKVADAALYKAKNSGKNKIVIRRQAT